ncbi:MAG: hypothetical protein IJ068_03425 [Bacilli bacterium]|nr:hypothetical protein [Bacilli bacterium]
MKKLLLLIPIILILTGCNSYVELNDLGVISEIGIEKDDKYKMYANVIKSIDDDFNIEEKTIVVEGDNILDLINNLSYSLNKKIYLSHLNLLVVDDSIKTFEVKELVDFFLNNNETRSDTLIVSTNNIKTILENSKFKEINELININNKISSNSVYTTMFDVINNYYLNKPIYISNIEYIENNIKLNGLKKIYNNKIEFISNQDTIYINYLLNNIDTFKTNIECDDNKYLYIEIQDSNTNTINNQILITNELKIIRNDCNLDNKKITTLFNNNLKNNLKKFTNKEIIIRNTIRSYYENN